MRHERTPMIARNERTRTRIWTAGAMWSRNTAIDALASRNHKVARTRWGKASCNPVCRMICSPVTTQPQTVA